MKKFYLFLMVFFSVGLFSFEVAFSQEQNIKTNDHNHFCGTDKATKEFYVNHPKAKTQTTSLLPAVQKLMTKALKAAPVNGTYIIPVVFHVFGTDFQGHTVDDDVVQSALDLANTDFNGLNDDYNTVDDEFLDRRGTLNIQFELAKIDPWGNACSGINYYPHSVKGFGNGGGYDDEIIKYAWDNYKYLNIYIMVDLYNDGKTNNSGVCWYPDTYMSDQGLARMVFNGTYLGSNSYSSQFASSFTHELGHYLNLMHTFENGCDPVNDNVDDTPTCDEAAMGCSHPTNCNGNRINSENYMDYNTECYSMFTLGQIDRMTLALDHPARVTLWQPENLEAVGLSGDVLPGLAISSRILSEANANDGSVGTVQSITAINGATFAKTGTLILNTDYTVENLPDGLQLVVDVTDNTNAEISFTGQATNHLKENSTNNINIVFNQSAITNDLAGMLNSAIRNLVINFKDPYRLIYSDTFNGGNDNDIIASDISVWKPFTINDISFGAYYNSVYASNTGALMLETYTLPIVCHAGTMNIQLIAEGEDIGSASEFIGNDGYYLNLPVFSSDAYTDWNGNEGYLGFTINNSDGEPCYGWMKVSLSADGNTVTISEYAYNEEPNATIKAGETGPIVTYSDNGFHESLADNDGSLENTISITIRGGAFTSTGTLTENSDFTFEFDQEGFGGITPVINVTSPTTAEFYFTGNANWADYKTFGTLSFSEGILEGGSSSYQGGSATMQLYFRAPYECISSTDFNKGWNDFFTPVEVTTDNNWVPFHINNDASHYFGGFKTTLGDLKFESYNVPLICNKNTYQIIPLEFNYQIDENSDFWVTHSGDETVHQLYTQDYTVWAGQTAYVGFAIPRENNYYKNYGWFKIVVNNEGTAYNITEWGMNLAPNQYIFAGGLDKKEIQYSASHFQEKSANNGEVNGNTAISVFGGKFSKAENEDLVLNTDYTLTNVPDDLEPHVKVLSENKAEFYFTGNATDHSQSSVNMTLTFQNPALLGNDELTEFEGYTSDFSLNLVDNYSIVHVQVNQTADALNPWQSFLVSPDGGSVYFGFYLNNNNFQFIADNSGAICLTGENIEALDENVRVSSSGNYEGSSGYLDLYNDTHQDWQGQTKYIGFRYLAYNNYYVYGWIKCELSADAQSLHIIDYAYNEAPAEPIYTGQTEIVQPEADFAVDTQVITEGESVTFEDKSINNPSAWEWTFEGGTPATSNEQNPKVTYSSPGIYKVTLIVTNQAGSNTKEVASYITVNEIVLAPVAGIQSDKAIVISGGEIAFSDNSENNPVEWEWTFENGTPNESVEQNPVITFDQDGYHKVTLRATNQAGDNTTESTILVVSNTIADFTASNTSVKEGEDVSYTTSDFEYPVTYNWQFEGGEPEKSSDKNPVVKYKAAGTYNVKLVATSSNENDTVSVEKKGTIVVTKTTGFQELSNINIKLFPNPVSSIMKIKNNQHMLQAEIKNIHGKTIKIIDTQKYGSLIEYDISTLKNGIYFLNVHFSDRQFALKFVKN